MLCKRYETPSLYENSSESKQKQYLPLFQQSFTKDRKDGKHSPPPHLIKFDGTESITVEYHQKYAINVIQNYKDKDTSTIYEGGGDNKLYIDANRGRKSDSAQSSVYLDL